MKPFQRSAATTALCVFLSLPTVAQPGRAQAVSPMIAANRAVGRPCAAHVSTLRRVVHRNLLPVLFNVQFNAAAAVDGHATNAPQAEISNNLIKMRLYLPDRKQGFYLGTRFDWSGVIGSLVYKGHNYYGPWFTKSDPSVHDFIFDGADIVAGSCGTITGPVEEFSTNGKALGYDQAPAGGTFVKIGVGVLRKPDDGSAYDPYRLYKIVDPGSWKVRTTGDSIEFIHSLVDPTSDYVYHYEKTIRLVAGRPEMVMEHRLKNMGKRPLTTSVYNHNFLVLDGQTTGPDFDLKMPFEIKATPALNSALAEVRGKQIVFKKALQDRDVLYTPFQGFGTTAADYQFTIENKKVRAGITITGDRPLSKAAVWSIRSVLSIEPFVTMTIDPDREFSWKYTYRYFLLDGRGN